MGLSENYTDVPPYEKGKSYQTGARVRVPGYVFEAAFWADEDPREVKDPSRQGWRLYDELYDELAPAGGPTREAKVIGYIPSWRDKKDFDYESPEPYRCVTHALLAFLTFREDELGELDPTSAKTIRALAGKVGPAARASGTRVMVSLGGGNDYGFLALMTEVGKSITVSGRWRWFSDQRGTRLLDRAVRNVADFVIANGLDGVDLDLECWWSKTGNAGEDQGGRLREAGPHPAGLALTMFACRLRERLPGRTVSAAVFATSWYGNNYDSELASWVEWLGVMTYDLTGSWNNSPVGPHAALTKIRNPQVYLAEQQGGWPPARPGAAGRDPMVDNPIFSVEDSLWYWSSPYYSNWQGPGQRVPRSKLVLGVPLYGYDFARGKGPDDQSGLIPPGYAVMRYKDIVSQFPKAHLQPNAHITVPGNSPRPPFVAAPGVYPYAHNIYYETPATAVEKLEFAKLLGAQGVLVWEMSNDAWEEEKSIVKALHGKSGDTRAAMLSDMAQQDAWSSDKKIDGTGISGSPALARFRGKLYCVYEGAGEEGWLRHFTIDRDGNFSKERFLRESSGGAKVGASQPHDRQLGRRAFHGPSAALVVFGGKLYCFSEQRGKTGRLKYVSTEDGETWSDDVFLDEWTGTSGAPGLCVYDGKLYCAHEEPNENGVLCCKVFEPGQAKPSKELTIAGGTSGPPSLVEMAGELYFFRQGRGDSGKLVYNKYDGRTWSDVYHISEVTLSGSPAATMVNDQLLLFHEGPKKGAFQDGSKTIVGVVSGFIVGAYFPVFVTQQAGIPLAAFATRAVAQPMLSALIAGVAIGMVLGGVIAGAVSWAPGDGTLRWVNGSVKREADGSLKYEWKDLAPLNQGGVTVSGPPGAATLGAKQYCIYEGAGERGELHYMTRELPGKTTREEADEQAWDPIKGANSLLHCHVCYERLSARYVRAVALNVEKNAPFLCVTLTRDANTTAFPEGATLQIKGPDGTVYDEKSTSEHVVVAMSGASLRALVVESPAAGTWYVLLEVPEGTGFDFRFEVLPSEHIYRTITDTLVGALQEVSKISVAELALALARDGSWLVEEGWGSPAVIVALADTAQFAASTLAEELFIQLLDRFTTWCKGGPVVDGPASRTRSREKPSYGSPAAQVTAADTNKDFAERVMAAEAQAAESQGALKVLHLRVGVWNINRRTLREPSDQPHFFGRLEQVIRDMLQPHRLDFLFLLEVLPGQLLPSSLRLELRANCGGLPSNNPNAPGEEEDIVLLGREGSDWRIDRLPRLDDEARRNSQSYRYPISATATYLADERLKLTLSGWHARAPGADAGSTTGTQLRQFVRDALPLNRPFALLTDLNIEDPSIPRTLQLLTPRVETTVDPNGALTSAFDKVFWGAGHLPEGVTVVAERAGRYFVPGEATMAADDWVRFTPESPIDIGSGRSRVRNGADFVRELSDHLPMYIEIVLLVRRQDEGTRG